MLLFGFIVAYLSMDSHDEIIWQCKGHGDLKLEINNESIFRNIDFNIELMSRGDGSITFLGSVNKDEKKTLLSRQIDFDYAMLRNGVISGKIKGKSKSEWDNTEFDAIPVTKNPKLTFKRFYEDNYIIYSNGEPLLVCSSNKLHHTGI
jgi:hypothetical protein